MGRKGKFVFKSSLFCTGQGIIDLMWVCLHYVNKNPDSLATFNHVLRSLKTKSEGGSRMGVGCLDGLNQTNLIRDQTVM